MSKAKTNGEAAAEYRSLVEFNEGDDAALGRLVRRYQELIWDGGGRDRSSKIFAIRQLIRYMDAQDELPPIIDTAPPLPPERKPKPKTKTKRSP